MLASWLPVLALAAAAPVMRVPPMPALPEGTRWAQLTIHERIIIRVPRVAPEPPRAPLTPLPQRWQEKRADRCVGLDAFAGARLGDEAGTLDFLLTDGRRLRARLADSCPALDYYGGFYLRPTADRRICAGRDAIRLRSGATCGIARFRRLVPEAKP